MLELRETWGRVILLATKAIAAGGGKPTMPCPCGSAKRPCPGRVDIGAGRDLTLSAQCDRCGFFVSISGWGETWWDWTHRAGLG